MHHVNRALDFPSRQEVAVIVLEFNPHFFAGDNQRVLVVVIEPVPLVRLFAAKHFGSHDTDRCAHHEPRHCERCLVGPVVWGWLVVPVMMSFVTVQFSLMMFYLVMSGSSMTTTASTRSTTSAATSVSSHFLN